MKCFKCKNEITDGTVCDRCGYDNKSGGLSCASYSESSIDAVTDFLIEDGVLLVYKGNSERVIIPDGVTQIGEGAFKCREGLKEVIIPYGVTVIGSEAFAGCCRLEKIDIPDSVTSIRFSAFARCESLKTVNVYDNVKSVAGFAFSGCTGLEKVSYPETARLGDGVFSNCDKLKEENIEIRKTSE